MHNNSNIEQINENFMCTNASFKVSVFRGIIAPRCHLAMDGILHLRNGKMTWRQYLVGIGGGGFGNKETNLTNFGIPKAMRDTS